MLDNSGFGAKYLFPFFPAVILLVLKVPVVTAEGSTVLSLLV